MNKSPLLLPTKMVPRRFYSSPIYIFLALLLIALVAANVIFFSIGHHSSPFATSALTSAESYLLKPGATLQGYIDSVDDPEFWDSFATELKNTKAKELVDNLKVKIKNQYYQQFIRELRSQVYEEKLQEFTNQLKLQIEYEKTKGFVESATKSFSLFDQLKQEYLETHALEVKNELLFELKNDKDKDKGREAIGSMLDKSAYYKFILVDLLGKHSPKFPFIEKKEKGKSIPPIHVKYTRTPAFSLEELFTSHVNLNTMKIQDLKDQHEQLVDQLYHLEAPPFVWGNGIVIYSGGDGTKSSSGKFEDTIAQTLFALKQLRATGSQLPVEVMFPFSDLDESICSMMYDKLNARCVSIETQLQSIPQSPFKTLLDRGVYWKPIGLLLSSFDNIISIDSNNIPLKNVDDLLSAKSYLQTKWLMWPHYWQKTTSPIFYKVSGMRVDGELIRRDCLPNENTFASYIGGEKKNQCLHDREGLPSATMMESSQMVFSKKTHYRSFLLSLYYNLLGPTHYYDLFYQNSATLEELNLQFNKPDRETYVPALHVFREQYHLMEYVPESVGPITNTRDLLKDTALIQADPTLVDAFYEKWRFYLTDNGQDSRLLPFEDTAFTKDLGSAFVKRYSQPKRVTKTNAETGGATVELVANDYKFPKAFFMQVKDSFINTVALGNGRDRVLGPIDEFDALNYETESGKLEDWELKFLKLIQQVSCEELKDIKYWSIFKDSEIYSGDICETVGKYVKNLELPTNV